MRKPIMAANWKMHKTVREAESFAAEFPVDHDLLEKVEIVIFPPFTALEAAGSALRGTGIQMGGQNMHPADKGAFTGEISPVMLKDVGCAWVLLGHSERRHIFKETSQFINEKIKAALKHGFIPLLCVGETLEERKAGRTEEINRTQLLESLAGVTPEAVADMVIAYEPVWAIGTGVNASANDAEATIAFIRSVLSREFGKVIGEAVRILYGGSVKPENIAEYMAQENIDGALVGGAGLEVESFRRIVNSARK